MKKIRSYAIGVILIFVVFLTPKLVNAQSITPSSFLIKNSDNTATLYQSSSRDYFSSTPYYSSKFEINLAGTSVDYNASYGIDMYLTLYVGAFSDYGDFGYANPELYINYNGLHQTGYTISSFTNTRGACSNVVCPYQLHLAFTFATQYQGTLYLALPYDIPYDTYGWTLNSMELTNYGSNTSNSDIIANNNQNTQNIIANNNSNFGNLINNQNSNTQSIINNQNANTDKEIDSQKVCSFIDKSNITDNNKFLLSNGSTFNSSEFGITGYISINANSELKVLTPYTSNLSSGTYLCFYNVNKTLISCTYTSSLTTEGEILTIPSNASFFRASINTYANKPTFSLCNNGNQALSDNITDMNNTINNDNVDNATNVGSDFFNNFQSDSHGLSGIITSPLRLLNALSTSQCSPLEFQLPFIHNQVSLACPRAMYENYFGVFFSLWQLITTGLISYNICINIYHKIHLMQNPYNDRIEVLNL